MSFLDAKWEFVKFLCHMEGPAGSTTFRELKNNFSFSVSGAPVISHAESRFGDGAGYFNGASALQTPNVAAASFGSNNFCIDGSFLPLSLESSRVLFSNAVSYTSPSVYSVLGFVVETTADGRLRAHFGNSSGIRTIESPPGALVVDEWHDFSILRHAGTIEMIINGESVATIDVSGVVFYTTFNNSPIRLGGFGSMFFYGYANNFRITGGDARADESLLPVLASFPAGNSVDAHREKVVFHCSFDTENQSTDFVDACGLPMVSSGAAKISKATSRFGATGCELLSGYVSVGPSSVLELGAYDFEFEWYEIKPSNTGNAEYSFSFSNAEGTDHGLSLRSFYDGAATLRINGVDVVFAGHAGSYGSLLHFSLVRSGGVISLFKNGAVVGSYSIGSTVISSDGRLYLGKGPISAPPGNAGAVRLDEMRLTVGLARNNPLASTIPVPADPFPRFGPRALSGSVMDENGLPLVRTVRCYRRADGRLVSETTSGADGAFVLPAADLGQHYVVVVDDVKNALIYDRVVPVLA